MIVGGVICRDVNGENPLEIAPLDAEPGDIWVDKTSGTRWVRVDPAVNKYGGWEPV